MGCVWVYMHTFIVSYQLSLIFSKLPFQVSVDFSMMFILCFLFVRVKLNGDGIVSSHSVCNQSYNAF